MTRILSRLFVLFGLLTTGCHSPRLSTVYEPGSIIPVHYNKIMVIGINKKGNDTLRAQLEQQLVNQLRAIGYTAISSFREFGRDGLRGLGEINTYQKLCYNGIDAVLTVSLIDQSNKAYKHSALNKKHPGAYYYDRIWNYRKIQDEGGSGSIPRFVWESILFDLGSLKPLCVMQTAGYTNADINKDINELPQWIIARMLREKIIRKQEPLAVSPKAF